MSPDDVTALNEQIAAMTRSGLPLDTGLELLAADMGRGNLKRVTTKLVGDLPSGIPLDAAFERQGRQLPRYYSALVAAGIRTGRLPEVLATLSQYSITMSQLRSTIVTAMIYPAIVLVFSFALMGFMSFYILPQFNAVYKEFGLNLPWITQAAFAVAEHPLIVGIVLLALLLPVVVLLIASRLWPGARRVSARILYRLPLIGTLVRSARLASFAELLAILVEYEVPMPEAFRTAGLACPDPIMASRAVLVAEDLEQGSTLAGSLTGRGLVPAWMAWMTGQGARHGKLDDALRQVANVYRRQVDSRVAILRSILPSFIIILVACALMVVFILSVFAPLYQLLEGLSL